MRGKRAASEMSPGRGLERPEVPPGKKRLRRSTSPDTDMAVSRMSGLEEVADDPPGENVGHLTAAEAVPASEHVLRLKEPETAAVAKARRLAAPKVLDRNMNRRNHRLFGHRCTSDVLPEAVAVHHRRNLRNLLASLMRQRKWYHACGVIGVLLRIPYSSVTTGKGVEESWSDVGAAMEVLRCVNGAGSAELRQGRAGCGKSTDWIVRRIFDLLGRVQPNPRARAKVQVELAHYLIGMGERQGAYECLRPTVDGRDNREDPLANLAYGLNAYCLWYEAAVEEVSKRKGTMNQTGIQGPPEGVGDTDAREDSDERLWSRLGGTRGGDAVQEIGVRDIQGSVAVLREGEDDWEMDEEGGIDDVGADVRQVYQKGLYEEVDERGFVQLDGDFWSSAKVMNSRGLDRRLFPLRLPEDPVPSQYIVSISAPRVRDLHSEAVKNLRQALASAPDMLPALLPLVQLLLAVHDIRGAVDEIDKCSRVLIRSFVPPSIKAALLESLHTKDPPQLAACHRDVLVRNPLSVTSLRALIKLHASGDFKTEHLLECLCLHLDVHGGTLGTWKTLASCLLEEPAGLQTVSGEAGEMMSEEEPFGEPPEGDVKHHGEEKPLREFLLQLFSSRHKLWQRKHFSPKLQPVAEQTNPTNACAQGGMRSSHLRPTRPVC